MNPPKPKHGQFYWVDLSLENPVEVLNFYQNLFGWKPFEVPMKEGDENYVDYGMAIDPETPGGGICHNRGKNAGLPSQWIPYFHVDDVSESLQICIENGGRLVKEYLKKDGSIQFVIVNDPKGNIFGMGTM